MPPRLRRRERFDLEHALVQHSLFQHRGHHAITSHHASRSPSQKRVLRKDYQYIVIELPDEAIDKWIHMFPSFGLHPYRVVGDGQFEYQHAVFTEEPDTTVWTLCFFETLFYTAYTMPPDVASLDEIRPS